MTPPTGYTEDALVEQPAIALPVALRWELAGRVEQRETQHNCNYGR